MKNMSPDSELSESFLTPPKLHAFESKDIYELNNKQGRIFSSSLYNNNPSQDLLGKHRTYWQFNIKM